MRLNRFLAAAGLGSRRGVEALIRRGEVTFNGAVCTELATDVTESDAVKVRGKLLRPQKTVYAVLHKPRGFVCTRDDERNRQTIFELLPADWPRVFHVGRLDMDSEGLLIVTNDGDLALQLTHPSHKIEKEYEVALDRPFDWTLRPKLVQGFYIEGGRARAEQVHQISANQLALVLQQGMKRQIRLMFAALGYEVKRLCRTRIGTLKLGSLSPGEWRFLAKGEIATLLARKGVNSAKGRRVPRREAGTTAPDPA